MSSAASPSPMCFAAMSGVIFFCARTHKHACDEHKTEVQCATPRRFGSVACLHTHTALMISRSAPCLCK